MVEIAASPYDYDDIPLVEASLVTFDGELTEIDADNVIVEYDDFRPAAFRASTTAESSSAAVIGFATRVGDGEDASCAETTLPTEASSSVASGCPCVRTDPSVRNEASHQDENPESGSPSATNSTPLPVDPQEQSRTFGAGAAGAVLGLLLGGPLLSVVLGVCAAFYSQQEGAKGDIARALGDVAIVARARFLELDKKHRLVDKGKKAATRALSQLKHKADKNPETKFKVQRFVGWCWKSLVEFENQHKLIQRGSIKAKEHLDSLVEQHSTSVASEATSVQQDTRTNEVGMNFASRE